MAGADKKNIEFVNEQQEKKDYRKAKFRDVLDGSLLTRQNVISQLPFVLFLTLLLVIYIGNRYHAERIIRKTLNLQTELKELRAKSISTASQLEYLSNQSQVARLVEQKNIGLKYSEKPPVKIDKRKSRNKK
jgi:Bacteriodetes cell division protein (FtsL-like)